VSFEISTGGIERHPELSHLNLSSVVEQRLINQDTIEVGAIEGADIFKLKRGVMADNSACRRETVTSSRRCLLRVAARHSGILVKQKACASVGAFAHYE